MTLVPGDYLWCRCSVQYFLACYEDKNLKSADVLATPTTLNNKLMLIMLQVVISCNCVLHLYGMVFVSD